MKLPRDINGEHLAKRLERLDFSRVRQVGSHIVLRHNPSNQTVSVPAHRPLKSGTLRGILKDVEELTELSLDQILKSIK